jgi:hypothetical protein
MAGDKSVRLFLLGDNADAKKKLEEIDLKADELAERHPELKIGIDTAAASLKLAALREEIKASTDAGGNKGFLFQLNDGITSLLSSVPLVGQGLASMSQGLSGASEEGASAGQALAGIASSGVGLVAVAGDIGKVISFFRETPGRIVSALGNLGSLLWNAGVQLLSGFLGGIEQKWHDVTSFVSGIAGWISDHKGPISYDATLLRPHGLAIMGGLVG